MLLYYVRNCRRLAIPTWRSVRGWHHYYSCQHYWLECVWRHHPWIMLPHHDVVISAPSPHNDIHTVTSVHTLWHVYIHCNVCTYIVTCVHMYTVTASTNKFTTIMNYLVSLLKWLILKVSSLCFISRYNIISSSKAKGWIKILWLNMPNSLFVILHACIHIIICIWIIHYPIYW